MPAPIALFAFKRPIHTQATLDSLARNFGAAESDLTVFCDGPRRDNEAEACRKVQEIAKNAKGFRSVEVVAAEQNKGLANSIIGGVSRMLERSDRLIVIEDDIESSPHMLNYLNACLGHFQSSTEVMSVSAFNQPPSKVPIPDSYPHDIWFNPRPGSWGWATWADRWRLADWSVADYASFKKDKAARRAFNVGGADMAWMLDDQMAGRVDSWLVRWMYAHYKHRKLAVYPRHSYTSNTGLDETGTHCGPGMAMEIDLNRALERPNLEIPVEVDGALMELWRAAMQPKWTQFIKRPMQELGIWNAIGEPLLRLRNRMRR